MILEVGSPAALLLGLTIELKDFLLPAALLLVVLFLLRRGTKLRRRSKAADREPLPSAQRLVAAKKAIAPDEANAWMVELHELARDTIGQIDTKVATLRQLLLLAEQQERRLRDLLDRAESLGDNDAAAPTPVEQSERSTESPPLSERDERIVALSKAGYSDVHIANQVDASMAEVRGVLDQLAASNATKTTN